MDLILKKHIYITGFMGTGKSSTGRLLASYWFKPFYDTDLLIEAQAGKTIPQLFKSEGENLFRLREHFMLAGLEGKSPAVVATGGGIVLRLDNRMILTRGIWINLNAHPSTIEKRLSLLANRPLLSTPDPRKAIESILNQRAHFYALAPIQIQTDGLSPAAVSALILKNLKKKGIL